MNKIELSLDRILKIINNNNEKDQRINNNNRVKSNDCNSHRKKETKHLIIKEENIKNSVIKTI